jgi:hypothetical protein
LEAVSSRGRRVGMKGAASAGSSTSFDMLLMITEDWRRSLVTRSRIP